MSTEEEEPTMLCYFRLLTHPDAQIAQAIVCCVPDDVRAPAHCVACAHFHTLRASEALIDVQKRLLDSQLFEVPDTPPPDDQGRDVS